MSNNIPKFEQLEFLNFATRYFCFYRDWWDGCGMDSVIWWQDPTGCFQKIMKTGEVYEKSAPICFDKEISESEFESILQEFMRSGLTDLDHQDKKLIYTHADDWYGVLGSNMSEGHWVKIAGGKHQNPKALEILDKVLYLCPEILPSDEEENWGQIPS